MVHIFSTLIVIAVCGMQQGLCIDTGRNYRVGASVLRSFGGARTNAPVSGGAAGLVNFSAQFPDDINPTHVPAQVVSGIGFLGAGILFRDGFNIQGINTAATFWCAAAVGLIAGTGPPKASPALRLPPIPRGLGQVVSA